MQFKGLTCGYATLPSLVRYFVWLISKDEVCILLNTFFSTALMHVLDHALQVAIMRKEFLTLELPSVELRNSLNKHLKECIEFSSSRELVLSYFDLPDC